MREKLPFTFHFFAPFSFFSSFFGWFSPRINHLFKSSILFVCSIFAFVLDPTLLVVASLRLRTRALLYDSIYTLPVAIVSKKCVAQKEDAKASRWRQLPVAAVSDYQSLVLPLLGPPHVGAVDIQSGQFVLPKGRARRGDYWCVPALLRSLLLMRTRKAGEPHRAASNTASRWHPTNCCGCRRDLLHVAPNVRYEAGLRLFSNDVGTGWSGFHLHHRGGAECGQFWDHGRRGRSPTRRTSRHGTIGPT